MEEQGKVRKMQNRKKSVEYKSELARRLVRESAVLLKNEEHTLPLCEGKCVAVFGRAQIDTFVSGNGSGAAHREGCKSILQACKDQGIIPEKGLSDFYRESIASEGEKDPDAFDWSMAGQYINSGIMYEIFGRYHPPKPEPAVPKELLSIAAASTDTAVWILGRNSGGEECDRHPEGDYYLTESERKLAEQICGVFSRVVLILNVNGHVDLSWTENFANLKAILFLGIPGEEGADALAELLLGKSNPCGKLAVTIARSYEDYPAAGDFTWDKDNKRYMCTYESYGLDPAENGSLGFDKSPVTVYREGIYMGYRYFSSFEKKPMYPFGRGLSYTTFAVSVECAGKPWNIGAGIEPEDGAGSVVLGKHAGYGEELGTIALSVTVKNTGSMPGKEVVQVYLSAENTCPERPKLELVGWEKTGLLQPGEIYAHNIDIPRERFSCYDEKRAAWVIPAGKYVLLIGVSSENLEAVTHILVEETVVVEQCRNRLSLRECNWGKIDFLSEREIQKGAVAVEKLSKLPEEQVQDGAVLNFPEESSAGSEAAEKLIQSLSTNQLACLCVGYGPGIPFSAFRDGTDPATLLDESGKPLTENDHPTGFSGYVSPAIKDKGIHSVFYKDGPAGIGQYAWPSEMLLACSFDRELWYAFGEEMGRECAEEQVDIWLAPAMNLIRHPLGGRNFEYFSEDPLLTASCGCEITKGVQENHPVLVCAKHFAANEQETWRRGCAKRQYDAVDSILEERTLRELYLRPFQVLVREAGLRCIMTSFNKINGIFAAGNAELCTGILRDEWDFKGVVVTDWGDMDMVVDGADAVHAGNDIVMPGGPPVIRQILKGLKEGRVTRGDLERSVKRLLCTFPRVQSQCDSPCMQSDFC